MMWGEWFMFVFGAKAGDEQCGLTPEFCKKYNMLFLRTALRITANISQAEDVVQTTMCKLIAGERDLRLLPEGELVQYVRQAVANNAITYMLQIGKRPEVSLEEMAENAPEQLWQAEARAAELAGDLTIEAILQAETSEQLRERLKDVPERQRLVLVLAYFGNYDTEEIAEAMGIEQATVRSMKSRGIKALREIMPQEDFEE